MKVLKYDIIVGTDYSSLVLDVNSILSLRDGWRPHGELVVKINEQNNGKGYLYMQPMTKVSLL